MEELLASKVFFLLLICTMIKFLCKWNKNSGLFAQIKLLNERLSKLCFLSLTPDYAYAVSTTVTLVSLL